MRTRVPRLSARLTTLNGKHSRIGVGVLSKQLPLGGTLVPAAEHVCYWLCMQAPARNATGPPRFAAAYCSLVPILSQHCLLESQTDSADLRFCPALGLGETACGRGHAARNTCMHRGDDTAQEAGRTLRLPRAGRLPCPPAPSLRPALHNTRTTCAGMCLLPLLYGDGRWSCGWLAGGHSWLVVRLPVARRPCFLAGLRPCERGYAGVGALEHGPHPRWGKERRAGMRGGGGE